MTRRSLLLVLAFSSICLCGGGVRFVQWLDLGSGGRGNARAIPVEVVAIEVGPITQRRQLSGTLETSERVVVAPRVNGRVERLLVQLGDPVHKGQPLAELDPAAFEQGVQAARADLAVARANVTEADSRLVAAERDLSRAATLHADGVVADSELDDLRTQQAAAAARAEVARAGVARAAAALESAKIEFAYTALVATWDGPDEVRWVAARHLRGGDPVGANEPVLTLVDLDPLVGVVFVTEQDYGKVAVGQQVLLVADAWPGRQFEGQIARIAPAFSESSRQARVELAVPNPDGHLKPGMFVRATLVLAQPEATPVVPATAVTRRGDQDGVFLVADDDASVTFTPVTVGIREGDRVQLLQGPTSGRVVTLGVDMVSDDTPITLPAE